MTDNLTPVITALLGNASQVGGSCMIGYGVLYGIKGVSNTMTDALENMPRYFAQPDEIINDLTGKHQGDEEVAADHKSWTETLRSTGIKVALVGGLIVAGVMLKKGGKAVDSKWMNDLINSATGNK